MRKIAKNSLKSAFFGPKIAHMSSKTSFGEVFLVKKAYFHNCNDYYPTTKKNLELPIVFIVFPLFSIVFKQ